MQGARAVRTLLDGEVAMEAAGCSPISLTIEFALIALMLGGAFFIQSRKKDFI